jgi:hypothetical protein
MDIRIVWLYGNFAFLRKTTNTVRKPDLQRNGICDYSTQIGHIYIIYNYPKYRLAIEIVNYGVKYCT